MERKPSKWTSRLRRLALRPGTRKQQQEEEDNSEPVLYRRTPPQNDGEPPGHQRSSNSWRRSIVKMHSSVKSAFKRHGNRTPPPISEASRNDNRITLASNVQPKENAYSIEPIGRTSPIGGSIETTTSNREPIEEAADGASRRRLLDDVRASEAGGRCNAGGGGGGGTGGGGGGRAPTSEIASLSNCYWYWGPISRSQAEERLKESPDGAFLVRDSTSDRYLFTMSFRNVGKILHCRIDHGPTGYALFDHIGYESVIGLVEDAVEKSRTGVFCYTKTKDDVRPNFPVRLTLPVSRYEKVPDLKYLARFVIRRLVIVDDADKLPLPSILVDYLKEEGSYF
ncbi:unnamed protein product [Phyllotreta striolata]|uniref:Uncharacterized protein n=1 Tax=Phyllotreta striolata TaxID=444603 RepID=A0A9N9TKE8_PHYSR|nr:unnamed protein product [Phyllotreta striolata]